MQPITITASAYRLADILNSGIDKLADEIADLDITRSTAAARILEHWHVATDALNPEALAQLTLEEALEEAFGDTLGALTEGAYEAAMRFKGDGITAFAYGYLANQLTHENDIARVRAVYDGLERARVERLRVI